MHHLTAVLRRAVATPLRRAAIFAGACTVLMVVWLQTEIGGHGATDVMDDTLQVVAPLFAAAGSLASGWAARGRLRIAWVMLGLSCLSWGVGSVLWEWQDVVGGNAMPYPSVADAGFLGAVPLGAAALLLFSPLGRAGMARRVLDGLVVAGAALAISWSYVLEPLLAGGQVDAKTGVSLAYPISDVLLFTLAVALLPQALGRARLAVGLICAGVLLNTVADSLFSAITASSDTSSTPVPDVLWVAGFFLIGVAARVPQTARSWASQAHMGVVSVWLPYAMILGAVVASLFDQFDGQPMDAMRFWDGAVLILLVTGRQTLALTENLRLARRLEHIVEERTAKLAARERQFRALVHRSTDSISVVDAEGVVRYQSESVEALLGYTPAQLTGWSLAAIAAGGDAVKLRSALASIAAQPDRSMTAELSVHHRDGSIRRCEATLTNLLDDADVRGIVVNMRDVTERRRLEDELSHQALHDRLTGLPNRVLFRDRLVHALEHSARAGQPTTVLFVDLDGFKQVNDTRGHVAGDAVLVTAAERIREAVRSSDTVARLGGDEFAVVLEGTPETEAMPIAERITSMMRLPVHVDGGEVLVSASVGVAGHPGVADPDVAVRNADVAMYLAKANGRDRVEVYNPAVHSTLLDEMELQADLRRVVDSGQLRLEFQPVVLLSDSQPVGMEALLRWDHPTRGPISPATFVPLAERAGLMRPIGTWVLEEACGKAARWFAEMPDTTLEWISVNISADQLVDGELVGEVEAALAASGLAAHHLVLEITESALVRDTKHVAALLARLRSIGVRVAIDDFGTGYSSLSYLSDLPVDILKVDRSFVEGTSENGRLSVLASTILDLTRNLHVTAIAEGVERIEQVRSFMAGQCELGQGFLFARPMRDGAVYEYLAAHAPGRAEERAG